MLVEHNLHVHVITVIFVLSNSSSFPRVTTSHPNGMQKDVITFVTKRVLCLKSFNQHWQMIRTDYSHRYPAQNNLESLRGDNSVHDYPWSSSNFHQLQLILFRFAPISLNVFQHCTCFMVIFFRQPFVSYWDVKGCLTNRHKLRALLKNVQ